MKLMSYKRYKPWQGMFKMFNIVAMFTLLHFTSIGQTNPRGTPGIKNNLAPAPVYNMQAISNDELIAEEPVISDTSSDSATINPHFFAAHYDVEKGVEDFGEWTQLPDGRNIWRVTIKSESAFEVGLIFRDFHLEEDAQLYLYDENLDQIRGQITALDNRDDNLFVTPFLKGNAITIEYVQPAGSSVIPNFVVRTFIHGYRLLARTSLACQKNAVCNEFNDYCDQIRSVCRIYTTWTFVWANCRGSHPTAYSSYGSGALINNSSNNFAPYILTARHVVYDQLYRYWCFLSYSSTWGFTDLKTTTFEFNYQSSTCSPDTYPLATYSYFSPEVSQGCWALASSGPWPTGCDMALLKLYKTPPVQWNVFYSGYDRKSKDDLPSWGVTCIHHPKADLKKVAKGNLHYSWLYPTFWGTDMFDGVIENGSSGSPLYCDGDKRIIGACSWALVTGHDCDDHNEQARFGRLRNFWGASNGYLAPGDPGREVLDGIDPATSCQGTIDINGTLYPAMAYNSYRPSITIQAGNYINIANAASTETYFTYEGDYPMYHIQAGESITISPSSSRDFFADRGSVMLLDIHQCAATTSCQLGSFAQETGNKGTNLSKEQPAAKTISNDQNVHIYPNPANETINIAYNEPIHIAIADMLGHFVIQKDLTETGGIYSFNTGDLASGTYNVFVKYASNQRIESHKVVIVK